MKIIRFLWKMSLSFLLFIAVCYFILLFLSNAVLINFDYNLPIKFIVETENIANNESLKREIIKKFVESQKNMSYYYDGLPRECKIHPGAVICYDDSALDERIINAYPDKIELGSHIIMRLNFNENIELIQSAYYSYRWSFLIVMIGAALCGLLLTLNINKFNLTVYYTGVVVSNLLLINYYVFKIFGLGSNIMSQFDLYPAVKVIFWDGLLIAVLLHIMTLAIQYLAVKFARSKIRLRLLNDLGIVMPENQKNQVN